jgi:hypothetical protein
MAIGTYLERQLQEAFPQYRRIWVQYSNKGQYHLCVTAFPADGHQYRLFFGHTSTVNFESVSNLLRKDLENR